MFGFLRNAIPNTHPLRLMFHKIKGIIAAIYYFFPADKLIVVGVTGTKGKTTTCNFIANILTASGEKVGMTSTVNFQINEKKWVNDTKMTSLSPFEFQRLLREMVKAGCKYAVLEVSSHAITQSRVFGINFDVAVLTNISPEHVEYHGSFDSYVKAKGGLFKAVSRAKRKPSVEKVSVLNRDCEQYSYFEQFSADRKISYGMNVANVYASEIVKKPEGSSFFINVPNNRVQIDLKIPGDFNIYNALAAASASLALKIPVGAIQRGLNEIEGVSGRFESVDVGQKFSVIVDYAHTAESLESLLKLYKNLSRNRLITVFGATGGGRDKQKRPKMGAFAHEYSDYIVVTNDDPYEEDELTIIDQISRGIPRKEGRNFWKIPDRREAIRLALNVAREGDTVVVAGKGAEEKIMLKDGPHKWNDRRVIEDLLTRDLKVEIF